MNAVVDKVKSVKNELFKMQGLAPHTASIIESVSTLDFTNICQ